MQESRTRKTMRIAATATALVAALSAAGCNTFRGKRTTASVSASDASYETGQKLPPDIKQILMAGGLNANDPSSPATRPIALAAANIDTAPAEDVVQVSATPPSRQVIMAARGLGPEAAQAPSLALQPAQIAPTLPAILLASAAQSPKPKAPVAISAKPAASRPAQVTRVASLPPRRVAAPPAAPESKNPARQPETQGSLIRFASVASVGDKPARTSEAKAAGVASVPAPDSQAKKIVRRF